MADKDVSRGGGRDRRNEKRAPRPGVQSGGGRQGLGKDRRQRRDDKPRNGAGETGGDNVERRPIILAKPDRDRNAEFPSLQQVSLPRGSNAAVTTAAAATEEAKARSEGESSFRADSPAQSRAGSKRDVAKTDSPRLEEASTTTLADAISSPLGMGGGIVQERCCKLIEDGHLMADHLLAFLTDNTDFLVVGIMGPQSAGKSTLLNHLGTEGGGNGEAGSNIFRVQSFEKQMLSEHCTNGVNAWISPGSRVIYLDCQPINSASVLDRSIQLEKRYSAEFNYAETTVEMHSMQFTGLMMNICHVVLFVQDWFVDASMIRFLQTAEMLKPSSPTYVDEESSVVIEYFPSLVFVQNKAHLEDFSCAKLSEMQSFYESAFNKSQMKIHTGLGMRRGFVMPEDSSADENSLNLFVIPDMDCEKEDSGFAADVSFEDFVAKLRAIILSSPKRLLTTNVRLTEKMWFHFVQKTWETIKNSTLYMEYNRLL